MSLVPVDKHNAKKRGLSESEKRRVRQQKEKADWHKRNGGRWQNK
jgi:hypothetical protein